MILACQACGGLEPYLIAAAIAVWGWGAWMLSRVFRWLRKPCSRPAAKTGTQTVGGMKVATSTCRDCGHTCMDTENQP